MTDSAERPKILVVDDEACNIKLLCKALEDQCEVLSATSGHQALVVAATHQPDLILLDIKMPVMDGYAVCRALKGDDLLRNIPVIFITALAGEADESVGLKLGAVDYIAKPFNLGLMKLRVTNHLEMKRQRDLLGRQKDELEEWNVNLKNRVLQQTAVLRKKLEEAHQQNTCLQKVTDVTVATVLTFADLLDQRNQQISYHSRTVAALAVSMAGILNLPQSQIEEIRRAALLRDIGLLCVSDRMLSLSPNEMSPEDLEKYRNHSVKGQEIMAISDELRGIGRILRHHHEEFDGSGFPDGLVGEQIPLGARIIHLANFIDQTFAAESGTESKYQTVSKFAAGMGSRFDPALSAAANQALQKILVARG